MKVPVCERKPSSNIEMARFGVSDSEEEEGEVKDDEEKKEAKPGGRRWQEPSWRDEFDDCLDDSFHGDEEDCRRLEGMTEREREEEIFR